jgi:DNA-binding transcriptional LysR family regulator
MSADRMQGLGAFVRVVEAGSFTGGARLLETTPSAVSKSIARLEKRLAVRLFQRSTRSLALTAEGRDYYERVAPMVRALEQASDEIGTAHVLKGRLRVAMPTELGRSLLEPITREFLTAHPDLRIEVSLSDRQVDLFHEGVDIAIRAGSLSDTGLSARLLGRLRLVLVAAPSYLDAAGRPSAPDQLLAHQHVRYRLAGAPYGILVEGAAPLALPAGRVDADDGDAMRIAARNGMGIAQILHHAVRDDIAHGDLEIVMPDLPLHPVPVHSLHAYGRLVPERARVFIDFVKAQIQQWAES